MKVLLLLSAALHAQTMVRPEQIRNADQIVRYDYDRHTRLSWAQISARVSPALFGCWIADWSGMPLDSRGEGNGETFSMRQLWCTADGVIFMSTRYPEWVAWELAHSQ